MDTASKNKTSIHEVFVQFLEQKELLKMKITPRKKGSWYWGKNRIYARFWF